MQIKSAKDLKVYKKAYSLAMEIYELSSDYWMQRDRINVRFNVKKAGNIFTL